MKRWQRMFCYTAAITSGVVGILPAVLSGKKTFATAGDSMNLNISFPYSRPVSSYDPVKIRLAPEYVLLENIFSPLVEMDAKGNVTNGVAKKFEWVGNEAQFTFREDLKTVDGKQITAEDAALSLKRLLILSGNSHGNIKDILCAADQVKSLEDKCEGIEVRGNKLILRTNSRKAFLFPMLSAIDFAVIPRDSYDRTTLEIKDYRNTTGLYYVDADNGNGNIILRANPNHYHFSQDIAHTVTFVPSDEKRPESSLENFKAGRVDLLTTIDAMRGEELLAYAKVADENIVVHETMKLRTTLLCFSDKGRKRFSEEQRISIGKQMKLAFREYAKSLEGHDVTDQLFPTYGEGALASKEAQKLKEIFEAARTDNFSGVGVKVHLVRVGRQELFSKMLGAILPGITVVEGKNPNFIDYSKNPDDMPDFFISAPDTGFLEDIGLISYAINAGYFKLESAKEKQNFLAAYAEVENKDARLAMLRDLHNKSLVSGVVIPLTVSPYVAVARAPWKISLPPLYGNSPLWFVTRK